MLLKTLCGSINWYTYLYSLVWTNWILEYRESASMCFMCRRRSMQYCKRESCLKSKWRHDVPLFVEFSVWQRWWGQGHHCTPCLAQTTVPWIFPSDDPSKKLDEKVDETMKSPNNFTVGEQEVWTELSCLYDTATQLVPYTRARLCTSPFHLQALCARKDLLDIPSWRWCWARPETEANLG